MSTDPRKMEENINNNEEIDFNWYVNVILKRFWLIAGITVLGLAAAILLNTFMRPAYKASALLMIEKEQAGKIDFTPMGSYSSEEDYYRTQYKLLESRTLLEKIYSGMNLNQYPQFEQPGGIEKLRKAMTISPVPRSRLVNVQIITYSPELSADISNTIAATFVADNVSNRISMGQDVIHALESTQKSARQQELLNSLPQVVNSDFIKNLKIQESALLTERAKLSAKYTQQHPDIISLDNQINELQKTIEIETNRLVLSIKIDLSGQFSGNNIRIIDAAQAPQKPVRPRKLLNIAAGLAAGMFLGMVLVLFLEFFEQSIASPEELDSKLRISFLGFVPVQKNKKYKKEYEIMLDGANVLTAENIRNIRTMVSFTFTGGGQPFLITGSLQGEGKTYLAANLAAAVAQTGKKTLLIDGDLRRGRLHRAFHLSNEKGLSDMWAEGEEKTDYKAAVQEIKDVKNLYVMTSGKRPPNPAELLNTPKLETFVQWAVKNYDQVIVDCPAVMPVSDTLLWGKYIPSTVFVVKYRHTNAKLALSVVNRLKKAGIKILGGVISYYRPGGLSYGKYGYYKNDYSYSDKDAAD